MIKEIISTCLRSALAAICALGLAFPVNAQPAEAPNIIVILADDLGYADLSSFGAQGIDTPHIDQLADGGLKFTQFYSAAPVCTPSRAGLLTGRYSARMGMAHVFFYDSPDGMPQYEITIAEQLKLAGYHTGMVGKWHLGHMEQYMPWNQGFDEFYGVPFSNDMANFFFYENEDVILEPIDQRFLTRRYTEKALDYVERHADKPFFLYLAHSMPHVPLYVSPEFKGTSGSGLYGDVVQELDWSTGQLVEKLRDLELLDNTLIIFSSDNGPWLAMGDHGGSAGLLRDGKASTFEGGQRVPTIAHWPASIAPGRVESSVVSLFDLMPTFSALVGVPLPNDRVIDGKDISALLTGGVQNQKQQFYYLSSWSTQIVAFRQGDWKLKLARDGFPKFLDSILRLERYSHELMLFNLKEDPYERNNIASQYPKRVQQMTEAIAELQKEVDAEKERDLYMRSTSADRKGYGPLIVKASLLGVASLLVFLSVLYGFTKLLKKAYKFMRGTKSP